MYEMAKKAREAMRGKAKRLAGEKDSKTDSSDFTPAPLLNADVKTGMRPISKQGYKKGGKVMGEKAETHAGRKPRKSGGRAITADSLINRDQKEANESREGKKHIGGMKKGGRAGKALGGMPADSLKGSINPAAILQAVRGATMGMKKGGRSGKNNGGSTAAERIREAAGYNKDKSPVTDPSYKGTTTSKEDKDALTKKIEGMKKGGRTARKAGGNVNYGPAENVGGKPGVSTKEQIAIERKAENESKPKRGKAGHYADGGAPVPVVMANPGPGPGMNMSKDVMNFGAGAKGSPYKKGGMAKHEDVAEDKALIKKMVKPEARTKKYGGGGISGLNMGPAKAYGGERSDKPKAAKKGMNVSITINTQPQPNPADQMGAGMPGMPPGLPPKPAGGIPVPMGMPAGGAPPAAAPMPMPMPMPPAGGGMPPMARKAGGKVYRSYKDLDAGSGSGLGRLEKTEIQKRKG